MDHGIERGLNLYKEKIIRQMCKWWISDEVWDLVCWLWVCDALLDMNQGYAYAVDEGWWIGIMKTKKLSLYGMIMNRFEY